MPQPKTEGPAHDGSGAGAAQEQADLGTELISRGTIPTLTEQLQTAQSNMEALLEKAGTPAMCGGCNAPILQVRHADGGYGWYESDGRNHYDRCRKPEKKERKKNVR
jgi:hypothetical protein